MCDPGILVKIIEPKGGSGYGVFRHVRLLLNRCSHSRRRRSAALRLLACAPPQAPQPRAFDPLAPPRMLRSVLQFGWGPPWLQAKSMHVSTRIPHSCLSTYALVYSEPKLTQTHPTCLCCWLSLLQKIALLNHPFACVRSLHRRPQTYGVSQLISIVHPG